jgi:DNA gyrase/topoisomerase IV subunit B
MSEDFKNLEKADDIKLLKFPDSVRQRIGMYLGGTDAESINNLLREIIDNSIDECQKTADRIFIDRDFNGFNIVADNGRGISIEYNKDAPGIISADLSISTLHSGSKFTDNKNSTIGMNGVGSSAVNAVSEDYILLSKITPLNYDKSLKEVYDLWESCGPRSKKDLFYIVWYKKGIKYFEGAAKKSTIEKKLFGHLGTWKEIPSGMSTVVMFNPDRELFTETTRMEIPIQNLRYFLLIQEKFYKKRVSILVEGIEMNSSGFSGYRNEFIKQIIPEDTSMNEKIDLFISFEADPELGTKETSGSVNSLKVDHGVHISYVEDCFAKALKEAYGIKHRFLTNGLRLCVIALASEVTFASQTKEKLKNFTKVKPSDFNPLIKEFQKIFRKDPEYWETHVGKLNFLAESMKSLSAAEKAQKIIDNASGSSVYRSKADMIPGFSDATAGAGDRWNCELFITEGLSPSGSLKAGRKGTQYHAIMPLRGKVKNVKDSTADQMMDNKELFTIFKVLGLGIDANNVTHGCKTPEEAFEKIKKHARYGKICIATDADEDGLAIQNGLLYAISKFARFLVDFGLVYISESPIYEQGGKYFYPSDPRQAGTQFPVGLNPNKYFRRFKGLGSLDGSDVYDSFYNPATRRLIQVTPEGIDYSMRLVEDIDSRKKLLFDKGILSNPYGFSDL